LRQYVVLLGFTNVSKETFAYYFPSVLKIEAAGSSEMLVAFYILRTYLCTVSQT
jgi:hypothetical protein